MITEIKINSSALLPEKVGTYLIVSESRGWQIAHYGIFGWEQENNDKILGWAELPISGLVALAMREEYARDAISERWNAPMREGKKALESRE